MSKTMTMKSKLLRWVCSALLLATTAGGAVAQTLNVAADSSLVDVLGVVSRAFEAHRPSVRVTLRTGASGALLEQVARGTATDVLVPADTETAALGLQRRLLLPDLRSSFASNRLVLVVPAALNLPVQRLADLARPEVVRVAMGRPASEAVGRYAREAINAQRLWPAVQRKALWVDDVREVLRLVAAAEVEAGFVFASDVNAAAADVKVVESLATTTPIRYPAHVTASSAQPALAQDFVAFLRGEKAQDLLKGQGFALP